MGNESSFLKDQQGQQEPNEDESNDRFHHVLDNASLFVCTGSSVGASGSATAGAAGAAGATARTTNNNNNSNNNSNSNSMATLLAQADALCISSPPNSPTNDNFDSFHSNDNNTINITADNSKATSTLIHPSSALFARALVSQVSNTTSSTSTSAIVSREVKLLKANMAVKSNSNSYRSTATTTTAAAAAATTRSKPIGSVSSTTTPLLTSIYHSAKAAVLEYDDDHGGSAGGGGVDATTTSASTTNHKNNNTTSAKSHIPTNAIQENGTNPFQNVVHSSNNTTTNHNGSTSGKYTVTIGLSLSRRHSTVGHLDTITRQGAFDFNELQDRDYKYVSSTDSSGWRAGGGERGGGGGSNTDTTTTTTPHKVAAPDTVHIPIIHIHAESPMAVDAIISALARGELFIPHMAVLPEALSVNGTVPPDIMVRFNCERTTNDDDNNGVVVPEEWPNWCLEFMHNQLYEYFYSYGAVWTKRPFCITLARKVRWKTVKHMNRYFAHAERVLDAWREMGPQYLTPQLAYNNRQGTTPEEVARPHGIYLFRNGVPTNYFAPNFEPPYTTKMTRSLLMNVLDKSWDKRKREWTNEPVPRLVTPSTLLATMCGCTDPTQEGFMASQVTTPSYNYLDEDHHGPQMTVVMDAMVHTPQEEEEDVMLPKVLKSTTVEDSFEGMSPQSNQSLVSSHLLNPMDAMTATATATSSSHAASSGTTMTSDIEEKNISALTTLRHGPAPKPEQLHSMIVTPSKPLDTSMEEIDGSQTTVLHMNSSSMRLVEKELERQQQRKNNNPSRLETPTEGTPSEEAETPFSKISTTSTAAVGSILEHNPFHTKNDPRPVTRATTASAKNESRDKYSMYISEDNGSIITTTNRSVQRSDSSVSLDYSMDSSLFGGGGTSIMSGGALLPSMDSSSVVTSMSNPSRRKNGTRHGGNNTTATNNTQATDVSSIESIPTDMELLAIGWAKAFDPNSGSYYYFTLDRSKIVWDNPLEPASTASESLQEGSTVT